MPISRHGPSGSRKIVHVGVHLIWATRHRTPFLGKEVRAPLIRYISGIVRGQRGRLLIGGGWHDHIHLDVELPPNIGLSALVSTIKSNSMRWLRATFPLLGAVGWQKGYAAFSVDRRHDHALMTYIRNQDLIHARRGAEIERQAILLAHGCPAEPDPCD